MLLKEQEVLDNEGKANPDKMSENKKKSKELGKKINELLTPK